MAFFDFTVTTDATGGVATYFVNGRLFDAEGKPIFTDKVFADAIEAEWWLMNDLFAQFMRAYIPAPHWRDHVESHV